jgi:hypothetical protein
MNAHETRIQEYLDELDRAMGGMPAARREEIVRDVRAHIDSEIADGAATTDAELETLLDGLGQPAEIAAAASGGENTASQGNSPYVVFPTPPYAAPPRRVGAREIWTIVLLLVGGAACGIGWVVGVVLLWTSTAWRVRDKVIGTLLFPGGLAGTVVFVGLAGVTAGQVCTTAGVVASGGSVGPTRTVCTGGPSTLENVLGIVFLVACVLGPIFSAFWLGITANRAHVRPPGTEIGGRVLDAVP